MTDIEALKTLLERVEKGDRRMFLEDLARFPVLSTSMIFTIIEAYDGSLDAALALQNAVLPHVRVMSITESLGPSWSVTLCERGPAIQVGYAVSDTPARAWLIAILKAKMVEGIKNAKMVGGIKNASSYWRMVTRRSAHDG